MTTSNNPAITLRLSEWTRFPGGRFEDGPFSGEEYRKTVFAPAVETGSDIIIDLNGLFTVGWSFLDEAFGHYVNIFGEKEFRRKFTFICDDDPDVAGEIEYVINQRLAL